MLSVAADLAFALQSAPSSCCSPLLGRYAAHGRLLFVIQRQTVSARQQTIALRHCSFAEVGRRRGKREEMQVSSWTSTSPSSCPNPHDFRPARRCHRLCPLMRCQCVCHYKQQEDVGCSECAAHERWESWETWESWELLLRKTD
jgi:hypothetical protein